MAYATTSDLPLGWGDSETTRSADRDEDGAADPGAIQRALDDASAEMDGYLGKVYKLPLNPVPPILRRMCCDIAIYRLSGTIAPLTKEKRQRYEDAIAQLEKIADGELALPPGDGQQEPEVFGGLAELEAEEREWKREFTGAGGLI